ncbi:DUF2614 family zinc ribbon-containing protein [Sphingobacterium lactis]|uniref:DUF2614 family zinc ribbon-containing protein n=1 Tax=Sphingobacterium lactis TaxID=797291 RepID=UPI003DA2B1F3
MPRVKPRIVIGHTRAVVIETVDTVCVFQLLHAAFCIFLIGIFISVILGLFRILIPFTISVVVIRTLVYRTRVLIVVDIVPVHCPTCGRTGAQHTCENECQPAQKYLVLFHDPIQFYSILQSFIVS